MICAGVMAAMANDDDTQPVTKSTGRMNDRGARPGEDKLAAGVKDEDTRRAAERKCRLLKMYMPELESIYTDL